MSATFEDLCNTINKLSEFHQDHDWAISEACADLAKTELSSIKSAGEPVPKLLREDYDQISFTWDIQGVKIFRCLQVGESAYTQVIER